jgi:hypothetical protein
MSVFGIAGSGTTPVLYPSGSPATDYSNIGFIPEIWSGKLIEKFYAATVLAAISNTDHEDEIKSFGDRIKIRTKPTITINNYLADGDLTLDRPSGGNVELYINKGKYFATILDDVFEIQSDLNLMSIWADDASEQMKISVDSDVLANLYGLANSYNIGSSAGAISGNINLGTVASPLSTVGRSPTTGQVEILDVILRLGQALDEQNIPETGRWLVMPTWAATQIKRSELRQVYLSGDQITMMRNGRLGMVDRFTIYVSNLLPNASTAGAAFAGNSGGVTAGTNPFSSGEFVMYAGHPHALTFASQMTKVETVRSERTFGNIFRGLQVYGYQVLDGKALATAVISQGGA